MVDVLRQLVAQYEGGRRKLAEDLGVSRNSVGHWLTGYREPDLTTLRRILELCGASDQDRIRILAPVTANSQAA